MKTIDTTAMCNALTNQEVRTDVEKQFYKLLADRLRGDVYAGGIAVACALFLHDIRHGIDGFTGQPLHTTLRGLPGIGILVMFVSAKQLILANVSDDVRADVAKALDGVP